MSSASTWKEISFPKEIIAYGKKNKEIQFGRKFGHLERKWKEILKIVCFQKFKNLKHLKLFIFTFGKADLKTCFNKFKKNW